MFYRSISETLLQSVPDSTNTTSGVFIDESKKKDELGKFNYMMQTEIDRNDLRLYWKKDDLDFSQEVFSRLPLWLNYLSLANFKNILFVGHFNTANNKWYQYNKGDRIVHINPQERWYQDHFVDLNILVQFLPIVKMAYGYTNFNMHVVKPEDSSRHRGIMHSLYKRYGCDIVPAKRQYKHCSGDPEITTPPNTKYDAIVFAGVPKTSNDGSFALTDVVDAFEPYLEDNCTIVDLYYQDEDPKKFTGAKKKNLTKQWTNVWSNRALWDSNFLSYHPDTRQTEYQILDGMTKAYRVIIDN